MGLKWEFGDGQAGPCMGRCMGGGDVDDVVWFVLQRQFNGQRQQPDTTTPGLKDGEKIPTRTKTPKKLI